MLLGAAGSRRLWPRRWGWLGLSGLALAVEAIEDLLDALARHSECSSHS